MGVQFLPPEPRALIFAHHARQIVFRQIADIVEGRMLRFIGQRIGEQIAHQFGRTRRRGDDGLRFSAESKPENRLIPGVRIAPGRQFVGP